MRIKIIQVLRYLSLRKAEPAKEEATEKWTSFDYFYR